MAMDRAYPEETINKHHMPGLDLECSGEEKERPTKEHLEKRPRGGRQAESWSESPRTVDAGGLLWMAYAPLGVQGLSKKVKLWRKLPTGDHQIKRETYWISYQ